MRKNQTVEDLRRNEVDDSDQGVLTFRETNDHADEKKSKDIENEQRVKNQT